uniref:Uncharacterized protein n=1 Tax=Peronospora matthiolae TaxID=2874970 RepID=A0AAV1VMB6_9STRA
MTAAAGPTRLFCRGRESGGVVSEREEEKNVGGYGRLGSSSAAGDWPECPERFGDQLEAFHWLLGAKGS